MLALTVGSVLVKLCVPMAFIGGAVYQLHTRGVGGCLRWLAAVLWAAGHAWDAGVAATRQSFAARWQEAKQGI